MGFTQLKKWNGLSWWISFELISQVSLDEDFPIEVDVVPVEPQLAPSTVLIDSVEKLFQPVVVSPDASLLDCLHDKDLHYRAGLKGGPQVA